MTINNSINNNLLDFFYTNGGGLVANIAAGNIRINNVWTSISATPLTLIDNCDNYIGIDNKGVIYFNQTDTGVSGWQIDSIPLWKITTSGGSITTVLDRRTWVQTDSNLNFKATPNPANSTDIVIDSGTVIWGERIVVVSGASFTSPEIGGANIVYADMSLTEPILKLSGVAIYNPYFLPIYNLNDNNISQDHRKATIFNTGRSAELVVTIPDPTEVGTSRLTVRVHPGQVRVNTTIVDSPLTFLVMTDDTTNYVEIDSGGSITSNTLGFSEGQLPLAIVVASANNIQSCIDKRSWLAINTTTIKTSNLTDDVAIDPVVYDAFGVNKLINTQATGTLTVNAPIGNAPINGQKLTIRIKSTNVQTFAWNGIYRGSIALPLPTTSSGSSLTDYLEFVYNSDDTKYDFYYTNTGF